MDKELLLSFIDIFEDMPSEAIGLMMKDDSLRKLRHEIIGATGLLKSFTMQKTDFLNHGIYELNISPKAMDGLKRLAVCHLGELVSLKEYEVRKKVGGRVFEELKRAVLDECDLSFGSILIGWRCPYKVRLGK